MASNMLEIRVLVDTQTDKSVIDRYGELVILQNYRGYPVLKMPFLTFKHKLPDGVQAHDFQVFVEPQALNQFCYLADTGNLRFPYPDLEKIKDELIALGPSDFTAKYGKFTDKGALPVRRVNLHPTYIEATQLMKSVVGPWSGNGVIPDRIKKNLLDRVGQATGKKLDEKNIEKFIHLFRATDALTY